MATQILSIVRFAGLVSGVPTPLPHGLNRDGVGTIPDRILPSVGGVTLTADSVNVTATRQSDGAPAAVDVMCEEFHSLLRVFGPHDQFQPVGLTPRPFVVAPGGNAAGIGFARFTGATSLGSTNNQVVTGYALVEEEGPHGVVLVTSGVNGDSFVIAAGGFYIVTATIRTAAGLAFTNAILTGPAIVNTVVDVPEIRSADTGPASTTGGLSWGGFVQPGELVWIASAATALNADADNNQVSFVRLA